MLLCVGKTLREEDDVSIILSEAAERERQREGDRKGTTWVEERKGLKGGGGEIKRGWWEGKKERQICNWASMHMKMKADGG